MRKISTFLLLALAVVGCADDGAPETTSTGADSDTADTTSTTAVTTSSTSAGTTSTTTDATTSSTTTDGGSTTTDGATSDDATGGSGSSGGGGLTLEECLANTETECGMCACNNCLSETGACEADEGCVAVRECARENMCTGAGCLVPCGSVINMYGGVGGMSVMLASALSACVEDNCMTECAG